MEVEATKRVRCVGKLHDELVADREAHGVCDMLVPSLRNICMPPSEGIHTSLGHQQASALSELSMGEMQVVSSA